MAKKIIIPPLVLARIFSMYRMGYTYQTIHEVTGFNRDLISRKCKKEGLQRDKNEVKLPNKINKYDHLFDEPVAQGKFYREYT